MNSKLAVAALSLLGVMTAGADIITFKGSNKEGIVSGEYWDGNPPSLANDYHVATTRFLLTPNGGTYTFGGNSLILGSEGYDNGYAIMMLNGGVDLTVNNLRLVNGRLGSWTSSAVKLRGNITVESTDAERPFEFYGQSASDVLHLYASVSGAEPAQLRTWCDKANQAFNLQAHGDCFANYHGTLTLAGPSKFSGETPRAGASTKMTVESGSFGGTLALEDNSVLEAATSEVVYEVRNLVLGIEGDFVLRLPFDQATGKSALVKVTGDFENNANSVKLEFPVAEMINANEPFGPIALMKFAEGAEPYVENFVVNDCDVYAYQATIDLVVDTDPEDGLPTLYIKQHGKVISRTTDWETVTNGGWSDGNPPSRENDYKISSKNGIYTPTGEEWSFPGRSLMISSTIFYFQSSYSQFDDLKILSGGNYLFGNDKGTSAAEKFYEPAAGNRKISGRIQFAKANTTLTCQSTSDRSLELEAQISGGSSSTTLNSGSIIKAQGYSVGGGVYHGYLGLFGYNDQYYGKVSFSYDGTPSDWANTKTVIFIRDGKNLGGPVPSQMIDALSFNVRNAVLCPLESCTLDTKNRCLWINADGATLEVPEAVELTLKQTVWFEKHDLHKTGAGTLVWGAGLNFSGGSTPKQGLNKLDIDAGTLRPLTAAAFNGLELTFAEGAQLELDLPESNTDGDIGQYGMLNTKWDFPLNVPAAGLKPILRNPNGLTRPMGLKVPICTVNATAAAAIRTNHKLIVPDSPFANYQTALTETANADGSVTFAVEFSAGTVHFIY